MASPGTRLQSGLCKRVRGGACRDTGACSNRPREGQAAAEQGATVKQPISGNRVCSQMLPVWLHVRLPWLLGWCSKLKVTFNPIFAVRAVQIAQQAHPSAPQNDFRSSVGKLPDQALA
jgi:hypothetical protein